MKTEPVVKSLAELSPGAFEPEPASPSQMNQEPSQEDGKARGESQFNIWASEHSSFPGYRHWGLNE